VPQVDLGYLHRASVSAAEEQGFAILSRRKLLGAAAATGGLVFMGGLGLWALRGRAAKVAGLRVLSDHQHRTLAALARALFPEGGAFPAGAKDAELAGAFDGFLADEPEWTQSEVKQALFLLEYGPVFFEGRLRTFSNLSDEERLAHFERWATSGSLLRRQVALGFRKFLALVFYDRPEAWEGIGYDGPLIRWEER
jgi:hypothetical protein